MRSPSHWRPPALLDAAGVVAFVVIGRASHDDAKSARGIVSTLWPFAVGTLAGWALVARRSPGSVQSGVVVCATTVLSGMALRKITGQRTAPSFIGVTTGFLGTVMIGGRLVAARWARRRRAGADSSSHA